MKEDGSFVHYGASDNCVPTLRVAKSNAAVMTTCIATDGEEFGVCDGFEPKASNAMMNAPWGKVHGYFWNN